MDIRTFESEFENLSTERQHEFLEKLFKEVISDIDNNQYLIGDLLGVLVEYEGNDQFGTEGFSG